MRRTMETLGVNKRNALEHVIGWARMQTGCPVPFFDVAHNRLALAVATSRSIRRNLTDAGARDVEAA